MPAKLSKKTDAPAPAAKVSRAKADPDAPKMPKMPKSLGACVDMYHAARQERLRLEKVAEKQKAIETFIHEHIIANIPKGDGGAVGTEYKAVRVDEDQFSIEDDTAFYAYIKKSGSFDLLNRAINQKAVRDRLGDAAFLKKFPKGVPGTKKFTKLKLSVTKK
jgi:hypothetical protein